MLSKPKHNLVCHKKGSVVGRPSMGIDSMPVISFSSDIEASSAWMETEATCFHKWKVESRLARLHALILDQNFDGALSEYEELEEHRREYIEPKRAYAFLLLQKGDFQGAEKICRSLLNVVPTDPAINVYMADALASNGNPNKALFYLDTALDSCEKFLKVSHLPNYHRALLSLACNNKAILLLDFQLPKYQFPENYREATMLLRQSLHASSIKEGNIDAAYNLVVSLQRQGRFDEANKEWKHTEKDIRQFHPDFFRKTLTSFGDYNSRNSCISILPDGQHGFPSIYADVLNLKKTMYLSEVHT